MFHRYVSSYTGEHTLNISTIDIFTNLIAAFDSSMAASYGIVRRASNFGLTGNASNNISRFSGANIMTNPGNGLKRWDEGSPPGNNAWALYEFTQASVPFWVLIQFAKESIDFNYQRFGEPPGAPASTQSIMTNAVPASQNRNNGVNIAIAFMLDGSSPWAGTTRNDGTDTKTEPVWLTDAVKFPRTNDPGGWEFLTANRMIPIIHETSILYNPGYSTTQHNPNPSAASFDAFNMLYHIMFDQDNILIFFDVNGQGNAGSLFYYGKFKPYHSDNPAPYICLYRNNCYDDTSESLTLAENLQEQYTPYGCVQANSTLTVTSNTTNNFMQPYLNTGPRQAINGGVYHHARRHSVGCLLGIPPHMNDDLKQIPNMLMLHDNSGRFKHMTVYPDVLGFEYPSRYGYMGRLTFFKIAKNVRHGHFFSDSELIIGNPATGTNKMIIPWDPNTEYGIFGNRYGTVWV